MNVREIVSSDREQYRLLRSTLDEQSIMWGASPGERQSLGDYAGKQFDAVMQDMRSAIFVAEDDGRLAGFLSLETSPWKSLSSTTTLMVGVLAAYQGHGIAKQLFEHAEAWAGDQGIHRIELLVFAENATAIGLYEKLGYFREGIRKESSKIEGRYIDEIYMAKLLP